MEPTYLQMYSMLPTKTRAYIRKIKLLDSAKQFCLRFAAVEHEYYELLAMKHDCGKIICKHGWEL